MRSVTQNWMDISGKWEIAICERWKYMRIIGGGDSEVKKVPVRMEDRRKNRTNPIGCAIRKKGDALSGYLTKAVNMFPIDENAEWKKTVKDLEEIGKLHWVEESRYPAEKKIEELNGRIAICGKNTEKQLKVQKKELDSQENLRE